MADTVFVGCKMPNGLRLDVHAKDNPKEFETIGTLAGTAVPFGVADPTGSTGGYTLTEIPADKWAAWLEQNKDGPLIKDDIVFVEPNHGRAQSRAREQSDVKPFAPALTDKDIEQQTAGSVKKDDGEKK